MDDSDERQRRIAHLLAGGPQHLPGLRPEEIEQIMSGGEITDYMLPLLKPPMQTQTRDDDYGGRAPGMDGYRGREDR
jgi:hypothetical protein